MKPTKRKWLERLEAMKKFEELKKLEEAEALKQKKAAEVKQPEPQEKLVLPTQEPSEMQTVTEELVQAPVASAKKKKS